MRLTAVFEQSPQLQVELDGGQHAPLAAAVLYSAGDAVAQTRSARLRALLLLESASQRLARPRRRGSGGELTPLTGLTSSSLLSDAKRAVRSLEVALCFVDERKPLSLSSANSGFHRSE